MKRTLLTVGGIAAFFFLLWLGVGSETRFECEACVRYGGNQVCRTVQGATKDEAASGAMMNACGLLAGGVNDTIRCQGTVPESMRCRER